MSEEGFRYRDLETGTFITRDPLGFVDGPNVYTYVVQNPWTKFDPLGLAEYKEGNDDPELLSELDDKGDHGSSEPTSPQKDVKSKIDSLEDRDRFKYKALYKFAVSSYPNALRNLLHYFGNSGEELEIDATALTKDDDGARDQYIEEYVAAMKYIQNLPPGQHNFTSGVTSAGTATLGSDWYYGLGSFQYWGKGSVNIDKNGFYKMNFEFHVYDAYDWHDDFEAPFSTKQAPIPLRGKVTNLVEHYASRLDGLSFNPETTGVTVTDKLMRGFHTSGLAKEYELRGIRKQTYKGQLIR